MAIVSFERISAPASRPRAKPSLAHGLAIVIHAVVLLIGGVAMAIMAIAVLLDGGSRFLDRKAGR